ncbi:MAG: hypothetical protein IT373_36400 [Polyangiaceae bacterium]|nr:hypothetical protein [Polyangiaceae bacterium]
MTTHEQHRRGAADSATTAAIEAAHATLDPHPPAGLAAQLLAHRLAARSGHVAAAGPALALRPDPARHAPPERASRPGG